MWLPIIASVGVGAAAYYSMTKNNQSLGRTVQNVLPFMSNMGGNGGQQQQQQMGNNSGLN